MTVEKVQFRYFVMRCCGHLLCWINPRFPTYCPMCGKRIYPEVKRWSTTLDLEAELCYNEPR